MRPAIGCERHGMKISTDWQVEILRITVFPVDIDSVSPSQLWETHIGDSEPEIHIQPGKSNQRSASYGNGEIYLVKTPSQVDWRYILPLNDDSDDNDLPVWGNLRNELTTFNEFSKDFLENSSIFPLNRLAFGAVLMKPTLDVLSTQRNIEKSLPHINMENAAEFGYIINRRRASDSITELQINRLSRWHVATLERNASTLDPAMDTVENRLEKLFAARLELDINTVPTEEIRLRSRKLHTLFEELLHLGLEIANKGDIL